MQREFVPIRYHPAKRIATIEMTHQYLCCRPLLDAPQPFVDHQKMHACLSIEKEKLTNDYSIDLAK